MTKEHFETLSYSETVKVNIGDYESRDFFLCFGNIKVNIEDGESFDAAFKRAKKAVRKKILKEEKIARLAASKFVDFNTKAKIRKK